MKDRIQIAATSDWHLGSPETDTEYPTEQEIHASLQQALDDGVDAYLIAGDFIHQGQRSALEQVASILSPYIQQGLLILGIVGNHEFNTNKNDRPDEAVSLLANAGVVMLEGQSYALTSKSGEKQLTVVGVSGEVGYYHDDWWRINGWDPEGRQRAREAGQHHREALDRELAQVTTDTVIVLTHRGIVPEVIGTRAEEIGFVSAQAEGFAEIIDRHAALRRDITFIDIGGHDHDKPPWEGRAKGKTKGGVPVHNVSSPVRRRNGEPLDKRFVF